MFKIKLVVRLSMILLSSSLAHSETALNIARQVLDDPGLVPQTAKEVHHLDFNEGKRVDYKINGNFSGDEVIDSILTLITKHELTLLNESRMLSTIENLQCRETPVKIIPQQLTHAWIAGQLNGKPMMMRSEEWESSDKSIISAVFIEVSNKEDATKEMRVTLTAMGESDIKMLNEQMKKRQHTSLTAFKTPSSNKHSVEFYLVSTTGKKAFTFNEKVIHTNDQPILKIGPSTDIHIEQKGAVTKVIGSLNEEQSLTLERGTKDTSGSLITIVDGKPFQESIFKGPLCLDEISVESVDSDRAFTERTEAKIIESIAGRKILPNMHVDLYISDISKSAKFSTKLEGMNETVWVDPTTMIKDAVAGAYLEKYHVLGDSKDSSLNIVFRRNAWPQVKKLFDTSQGKQASIVINSKLLLVSPVIKDTIKEPLVVLWGEQANEELVDVLNRIDIQK
jgi:hypothetical protein